MDIEGIARAIELILAPVVMINGCALFLNGILSSQAAISGRLHALASERLQVLSAEAAALITPTTQNPAASAGEALDIERLREIDTQLPILLKRHKLAHDAIVLTHIATILFILTILAISVADALDSRPIAAVSLTLFLVGTLIFLNGVLKATRENRASHQDIQFELNRVLRLTDNRERLLNQSERLHP
jgi:hypothetical protein